jgi:predicted dehydrogenase
MHNTQVVPDGMKTSPAWQLDPANVGILMGHAIHNIDQVRWLTGREVAKVFAKVRSFGDYEVDSTSDLILTLDDGTVCTIFASFEVPKPGFPRTGGSTHAVLENALIDADWYGEMRVALDGGDWEVRATQPTIDWQGMGFLDPVRLETYAITLRRLVEAARTGDATPGTGWDGRQAVAIAAAAYESSEKGIEVAL